MGFNFLNSLVLASTGEKVVKTFLRKKQNRIIFTTKEDNTEYTLNFDIIKNWNYKNRVKLTENPVEQGVNINDHRIIQPTTLTIEVGVSNVVDPIRSLLQRGVLQTTRFLLLGNRGVAETPSQLTYRMVNICLNNAELFDIDTPLGLLGNYLLVDIKNKINVSNYETFEGTLVFQEYLTFINLQQRTTEASGVNKRKRVNNLTLTQAG